ncbi:MAG TPA: hypothetical protein VJN18_30745 [Polyangiaceae bacterium]|nr:hypothetical protein [Polyangiaceae bacterium]
MPCLLGCLALSFPRFVLFLVWLFGGSYLERAYDGILVPLLGFFFLPLTTLAFAYSQHSLSSGGHVSSIGWLITSVALLIDIGLIGGGSQSARRWREHR